MVCDASTVEADAACCQMHPSQTNIPQNRALGSEQMVRLASASLDSGIPVPAVSQILFQRLAGAPPPAPSSGNCSVLRI